MQDVVDLNRHADLRAYHRVSAVARALNSSVVRERTVAKTRILLVDDYPDALEMWGLYFRSLGYEVVTAEDGLQAVEEAHRTLPDVVILDLDQPGITGFEAAVRLRSAADTAEIPLIAATCYSHATLLDRARQCGFDSFLVKPCEPTALVAEVERLRVDGRRRDPEAVPGDSGRDTTRSFGNPLDQNL
jgi:CheY-like chemotaxis protein